MIKHRKKQVEFIGKMINCSDSNSYLTFVDITKAVDMADNNIFLTKLQNARIRVVFINLTDFLKSRRKCARTNGVLIK